jgi:hypothetical protein
MLWSFPCAHLSPCSCSVLSHAGLCSDAELAAAALRFSVALVAGALVAGTHLPSWCARRDGDWCLPLSKTRRGALTATGVGAVGFYVPRAAVVSRAGPLFIAVRSPRPLGIVPRHCELAATGIDARQAVPASQSRTIPVAASSL